MVTKNDLYFVIGIIVSLSIGATEFLYVHIEGNSKHGVL